MRIEYVMTNDTIDRHRNQKMALTSAVGHLIDHGSGFLSGISVWFITSVVMRSPGRAAHIAAS